MATGNARRVSWPTGIDYHRRWTIDPSWIQSLGQKYLVVILVLGVTGGADPAGSSAAPADFTLSPTGTVQLTVTRGSFVVHAVLLLSSVRPIFARWTAAVIKGDPCKRIRHALLNTLVGKEGNSCLVCRPIHVLAVTNHTLPSPADNS